MALKKWLVLWFAILQLSEGHRFFPSSNSNPTYRPTVIVSSFNRAALNQGPVFSPVFSGSSRISSSSKRRLPAASTRIPPVPKVADYNTINQSSSAFKQAQAANPKARTSKLVEIVESSRLYRPGAKPEVRGEAQSRTASADIPIISLVPKFKPVDLETDLQFIQSLYEQRGYEGEIVREQQQVLDKEDKDEYESASNEISDELPVFDAVPLGRQSVDITAPSPKVETVAPVFSSAVKGKERLYKPIIIRVPSSQAIGSGQPQNPEFKPIVREKPPTYKSIEKPTKQVIKKQPEATTFEPISRSQKQTSEQNLRSRRPSYQPTRGNKPASRLASRKPNFEPAGRKKVSSHRKNTPAASSKSFYGKKGHTVSYRPVKASYKPTKPVFKPAGRHETASRLNKSVSSHKQPLLDDEDDFEEADDDDFQDIFEQILETNGVVKPRTCTRNGELFADERNCRKYYKCAQGLPSHQDCPGSLIFHRGLKICNWPDATDCIEDPNAPLPETSSSDRHPAKVRRPPPTFNAVDSNIREPSTPSSQRPRPDFDVSANKGGPSYREALDREELLTSEYPLFKEVKRTVRTLETSLVEKIEAKKKDNPDNVKRVEFILSEDNYEDLFPRRHETYTYKRLLQAVGKFPAVCGYVGTEDKSDKICRKTLATMFAHFTQETGNHNPSDKEFEEWRQGLSQVRESGCTETSPGCGYNLNCEDKDSITKKWACGKDQKGSWKKYFGRGAKQLSYNFNYGQFSQAMFGDGRLLLDFPDFVATTWLNLASATWFYTTPQPPKPSMLHVIDGTWVPNSEDRRNGIEPGFGATINIINGGLECNTKDGRESRAALNRIAYYKQFAWYLYVDYEDETLGCAKQQQFTAGGAGAIPIYWDKDWSFPFSCRLVPYQTAFSALAPGEYVDCIEENFNLKIDRS